MFKEMLLDWEQPSKFIMNITFFFFGGGGVQNRSEWNKRAWEGFRLTNIYALHKASFFKMHKRRQNS